MCQCRVRVRVLGRVLALVVAPVWFGVLVFSSPACAVCPLPCWPGSGHALGRVGVSICVSVVGLFGAQPVCVGCLLLSCSWPVGLWLWLWVYWFTPGPSFDVLFSFSVGFLTFLVAYYFLNSPLIPCCFPAATRYENLLFHHQLQMSLI